MKSLGAKGQRVVSSDGLEKWHFLVIPGRCQGWRTDLSRLNAKKQLERR